MCRFLSAIVKKNGEVICLPEASDSHEDLIAYAKLRDESKHIRFFVRVEFYPPDGVPLYEAKKYELHVDEPDPPDWFDESIKDKVERKLYRRVKKMLVSGEEPILLGGCYILHGEAKVGIVKNSLIKAMYNSSRVGEMYNSSQVGGMHNSSQVGGMYGSSQIINDKRRKK